MLLQLKTLRRLVSAGCCVVVAAGCGGAGVDSIRTTGHPAAAQATSQATSATPVVVQDGLAALDNDVAGDRLTQRMAVRSDVILVAPSPGDVSGLATSDVMSRWRAAGGELPGLPGTTPRIFLARMTDYSYGTAGPGNTIIPTYVDRLVWVIAYHDVYDGVGSAGGGAPPTTAAAPSETSAVPANVTAFVDATSGDYLFELDDTINQPVPGTTPLMSKP